MNRSLGAEEEFQVPTSTTNYTRSRPRARFGWRVCVYLVCERCVRSDALSQYASVSKFNREKHIFPWDVLFKQVLASHASETSCRDRISRISQLHWYHFLTENWKNFSLASQKRAITCQKLVSVHVLSSANGKNEQLRERLAKASTTRNLLFRIENAFLFSIFIYRLGKRKVNGCLRDPAALVFFSNYLVFRLLAASCSRTQAAVKAAIYVLLTPINATDAVE